MLRGLIAAVAALFVTGHVPQRPPAENWAQWRGPSRDGRLADAQVPDAWPARYEAAWRVEVGEGYASPVTSDGRVFMHSREDPDEIVTAIDLASGDVLWQQRYAAPYGKNSYATGMAKGPNATALVAGGRVYTLGATAVLSAWEAATGELLWRRDYSDRVDFSQLFCGTAASPVLVDGQVIVQVGSDVHGGLVTALDPATGEPAWEWRGDGPGYASPRAAVIDGVTHLVTLTNAALVGLDAATGRLLWTTPFANSWHENIVTPAWAGDLLVASSKEQGTVAYRVSRAGDGWQVVEAWRNQAITMYMSSPVVADGLLYGLSNKRLGSFVALDASSGALRWQTTGREGETASVLLAPRHVLFLTDAGALTVAARGGDAFDVVRRYDLDTGATWAVPIVLGRDLIVRDAAAVIRLAGRD